MANEIEVRLVLDDGSYKKAILQTEKSSKTSGKKIGSNLESGIGRMGAALKRLNPLIAGVAAAFSAAFAGRAIISATIRQENAVNQLNQALMSAGTFSREASEQIQAFAASIEATTITSDEAALELYSLARAMSTSNEQAQQMTKAALELSAATGMSADSAVKNLGKSLSGLTGELGESLPAIKTLTAEQLKAGAAMDFVLQRFGGSAAAQVKTFSGSITQMANSFGTLLEKLGSIVTDSKAFRAVIGFLAEQFTKAANAVGDFGKSGRVVDQLVISMLNVAKVITQFILPPIEMMVDAFQAAFQVIRAGFMTILTVMAETGHVLVGIFGENSAAAKGMKALSRILQEETVQAANDANNAMAQIGTDFAVTDSIDQFIEGMKVRAETAAYTTETMKEQVGNNFSDMAMNIKDKTKQIADAMKATLAGGISRGIQNITNALLKGENVFEAFAGSVLGVFGDLAIQLGEFYIAQGIASIALKGLDPSGQIAAGAGLIALGTILKSFFASGGTGAQPSQTATGGPVAGGGLTSPADEVFTDPEEALARGPEIAVNIQGNVFDRKETGLEIVDIINEAFEQQGAVVRTA